MKAFFLITSTALLTFGSLSVSVIAQSAGPTKAETVASASGALDVYEPGKRMTIKDPATGVSTTYTYGEDVVYVTPAGTPLSAEQVKARMKAGLPVSLDYVNKGDTRVVQRVIVQDVKD